MCSFKEGSLIYHGREYKVRCMPRQIKNHKINVDEHGKYIKLSSGIIFPLDNAQVYSDYRDSKNDNYISTNISFNKGVLDENGKVLNGVFKKLASIDGGKHTFILQNTRKEGQRLNQYMGLIPSYLGKMGLVMLLIVSLGIFGNLKNILRRRKKEIAIRMALGEQIPCMLNAFVVEFSIIFSTGTILGFLLGEGLRNIYAFDAIFAIGFSYWTLIISFAWVLIIVAISSLTVFMKKDNFLNISTSLENQLIYLVFPSFRSLICQLFIKRDWDFLLGCSLLNSWARPSNCLRITLLPVSYISIVNLIR